MEFGLASTKMRGVGLCPRCRKQVYGSRAEARKAARAAHPGLRLQTYLCDGGPYWHNGKPDPAVREWRLKQKQIAS